MCKLVSCWVLEVFTLRMFSTFTCERNVVKRAFCSPGLSCIFPWTAYPDSPSFLFRFGSSTQTFQNIAPFTHIFIYKEHTCIYYAWYRSWVLSQFHYHIQRLWHEICPSFCLITARVCWFILYIFFVHFMRSWGREFVI